MLFQPANRCPYLVDDTRERNIRRQCVANHGDMYAMSQGTCCQKAEIFLGTHLPVATMDEDEQGTGLWCREIVNAIARCCAVAQIQMSAVCLAPSSTALGEVVHQLTAIADRRCIVVGRVQCRSIHVEIDWAHSSMLQAIRQRWSCQCFRPLRSAHTGNARRSDIGCSNRMSAAWPRIQPKRHSDSTRTGYSQPTAW